MTFTHYNPDPKRSHKRNALTPPGLCDEAGQAPDTQHARRLQALSLLPSSLVPSRRSVSSSRKGSSGAHSIHAQADGVDHVQADLDFIGQWNAKVCVCDCVLLPLRNV